MKNIFLISFLFLIVSCKMVDVNQPKIQVNESITFNKDYFNSLETDYLFKGQIEVYGNQISTLLVIKKIDETKYRVAITNDFGNKLIDIEIENEQYKIVYVAKDLNKKIFLNPLVSDILFLVKKSYICTPYKEIKHTFIAKLNNENKLLIEVLTSNFFKYSVFKKDGEIIKHFEIHLEEGKINLIQIEHQELKLKLNFARIFGNN